MKLSGQWVVLVIGLLASVCNLTALQLTGIHSPDPVVVGGKLTFTFTLENDGAAPASGTLFTNRLPPNTVFVSATVTNGTYALSNNVFAYQPDTIPPGDQVVFKMVITPVTAQIVTNLSYWVGPGGELAIAFADVGVASVLPGPKMNVGRAGHKSTLLQDGRVLLTGGLALDDQYIRATASAEVYNPSNEVFTLTEDMNERRQFHSATLLTNGMVLIAGGKFLGAATSGVDVFNPTNGTFTAVASLSVARSSHTATLMPDGNVIFAGGAGSNTLIERFYFTNAQWSVAVAGNLSIPRSGHLATLLDDGKILFAGGGGGSNPFAEEYDPVTGVSTTVAPNGHAVPVVAVAQGKVLLHGSLVQPHLEAEMYSIQSNSFTTLVPPPDPHYDANYLTLSSGEVLISAGIFSFAVDIFDPRTGTFTASYPMAGTRHNHSAVQLLDGRILLTGGYDLEGTLSGDMRSTELYVLRLDQDHDGMDDAWEIANGLDPSRREDSIEDADEDGHTNLQEYLAGTDPQDPNSVMRIETIQKDANNMRIRFTSVSGKRYRVERATDIVDLNWAVVADDLPGTGAAIDVTDPVLPGVGRQLYRVRLLP